MVCRISVSTRRARIMMFRTTSTTIIGFCVFVYFAGSLLATIYMAAFCLIYCAIGNNTR